MAAPALPPPFLAAAVQLTSTPDLADNLRRALALCEQAAAQGAKLIGLPENYSFISTPEDKLARAAEISAASVAPFQDFARRRALHILLGGYPRIAPGGRITNTAALLGPEGDVLATYDKIHLFDINIPGGPQFQESAAVHAGAAPVLATTALGPIGLSVCYDLRFPELYRHLTARGARVLAVPAAFTMETGRDHWLALLRARAIENQAYVFAPAQYGHHAPKRQSYGHACIIDPWGTILAQCGDHEGFALALIDYGYQDQIREQMPCQNHRRPELFPGVGPGG